MAESIHSVVKVVPSLGRSCKIGDVIDCCNDTIVSGEKVWPEIGKSIEKELIQKSSVKGCSSIDELYESLGVDVSTRIHVDLGFIATKGLVKKTFCLNEQERQGFGMAIIHRYKTKMEFVLDANIGNLKLEHVATLQSGTHIITGITYGCYTIFWSKEGGSLHEKRIKSLEDLEDFGKTYPHCGKIVSHVNRDEENGTILDGIRHMKDVIESLEQDQERLSAFPLLFHLYPIEYLAKIGARSFVEIPTPIASKAIRILDESREAEYTYSKLQAFTFIKESKAIQKRLADFKDIKQKHTEENKEKLKELVQAVHQGKDKERELEELLNLVETSPFNGKTSKGWISLRKIEFEYLQKIFEQFESVPVAHTAQSLKKKIESLKNDLVLCFVIQIPNKDKVIEQMRQYQYEDDDDDDDDGDGDEEEGLEVDSKMWKDQLDLNFDLNSKNFHSLIERYTNDKKINFLISFEKIAERAMRSVIQLYQDGNIIDRGFMPLCQPHGLEAKELNDTRVEIKWKVHEESCKKEEYKVMVKTPNQDMKTYTTKKVCLLVPDLKPETDYDVQVVACIAGIESEWSQACKVTTPKSDVTSPPGQPVFYELTYPQARLEWSEPERVSKPILKYKVYDYQNILKEVDGQTHQVGIDILPNDMYTFTVQADCGEYGLSKHSDPSEPFFKKMSDSDITKEGIKAKSKLLSNTSDSPKIYLLNLETNFSNQKLSKYSFGIPNMVEERVVMFLGATGSGKTTLINGIINYIVGINWKDDFRIRLIPEEEGVGNQAKSQTSKITAYTIYHQEGFKIPYTLTLVDTPGFGDTSGVMRDKEIISQMDHFFRASDGSGLDHLDGIGFVTQSSLARLTQTQRYIFDSILSLFGKDIEKYIFPLLTFADGKEPQVLSSLEAAEIPFEKYFKFNNSALFEDNRVESKFNKLFWEMGELGFAEFIDAIMMVTPLSLTLTKEVLSERETLEVQVQGIHKDVRQGLNKLEQLKTEWQVLEDHENEIRRNENFEYSVEEEKTVMVDIEAGKYTTNCITCNRTCHFPCTIPNDEDKSRCAAMEQPLFLGWCQSNNDIYCGICSGNCSWKMHKNMQYTIEIERVTVTKTAEDLKQRYQTAQGKKITHEEILAGIIGDIQMYHMQVAYKTIEIKRCVARLHEIALKPNPLSAAEYVQIMIEAEKTGGQPGWHERVQQLEEVKQTTEFIDQLVNKGHDPFQDYEDTIQKVEEYYRQKKARKGRLRRFWDYVITYRSTPVAVPAIEYPFKSEEDDTEV